MNIAAGIFSCIVVVALPPVLAVVDVRTGRGFALGIFSTLMLITTVVVVVSISIAASQQTQPITIHNPSAEGLLVFYFVPAVYIIICTVISASIVAGIARRWLWIVGIVAAAVVPFLVAALPYSVWDLNKELMVRQFGFLGVLVAPDATILAYSITRIVHPFVPAHPGLSAPSA